jgi:vacuolar-type H+-ATPase subunit E/Vma4
MNSRQTLAAARRAWTRYAEVSHAAREERERAIEKARRQADIIVARAERRAAAKERRVTDRAWAAWKRAHERDIAQAKAEDLVRDHGREP